MENNQSSISDEEHQQQQEVFLRRLSKGFCSMFWPTSDEKAYQAEFDLLKFAEYDVSDSSKIFWDRVPVESEFSANPGKTELINTLIYQSKKDCDSKECVNVVLVHGFGAGLGFWYRNIRGISEQIPQNNRIFAFDWLGMGRSSRPPFPKYSQDLQAREDECVDVEEKIIDIQVQKAIDFFIESFDNWRSKQQNLNRFFLIGHSMGGYLAALYALKYPEHVQKLLLASPVGIPPHVKGVDVPRFITGHVIPNWVINLWNNHYTPQGLIRSAGPIGPSLDSTYIYRRFPYLSKEEKALLSNYAFHLAAQSGSGEYTLGTLLEPGAWAREPLHHHLKDLKMPTAFLYGDHDWMDYRNAVDAAEGMVVTNAVIRVPNSGHHLNLDNYPEFNRICGCIIMSDENEWGV
jgi:cardiolipin-specific phospholipase